MKKILYIIFMKFLNSVFFNKLLRSFTKSKFSSKFIGLYIKKFDINREELLKKEEDYESLNEFFTRNINLHLRPLDRREDHLSSPCDGRLSLTGMIGEDSEFTIKGKKYSIGELLKDDAIGDLRGGTFSLIYLSPSNYHRFHSICSCRLIDSYALGDKSDPVNDMAYKYGGKILSKNYRLVHKLENERKQTFYAVYIGAVNVNSIIIPEKEAYKKGEEVGYFEFGSSIMLLFPKDMVRSLVDDGVDIKVGQGLFQLKSLG